MKHLWGSSCRVPSTPNCNSTTTKQFSYSDFEVIPFIFSANSMWVVLAVKWPLPEVFLPALFRTEHSGTTDTCLKKSNFENKISKSFVSKHWPPHYFYSRKFILSRQQKLCGNGKLSRKNWDYSIVTYFYLLESYSLALNKGWKALPVRNFQIFVTFWLFPPLSLNWNHCPKHL